MNPKVLITGPPRCGKSTLINSIITSLQKDYIIYGFLTPEIRKGGKRIGFQLEDIQTGKKILLAQIGNFNTKYKLGRYSIFLNEFDRFLIDTLESDINKISNTKHQKSIIIIDEIGKMELSSKLFQEIIKNFFQKQFPIIAAIGEKLNHPLKKFILRLPDILLFNLNRNNQHLIIQKIKKKLEIECY